MTFKNIILILFSCVIVFACQPGIDEQVNANKELIKAFTEATNKADWDAFDELLTDDFSRHSQASPVEVNTREAFVKLQEDFYNSCPDQKITPHMTIGEGDMVAVYATYTGTMTGPLGDLPATGKSMESKFITIFRIEDGRIAEIWVEWDNLAMLTQLGHFPPAGGSTDPTGDQ